MAFQMSPGDFLEPVQKQVPVILPQSHTITNDSSGQPVDKTLLIIIFGTIGLVAVAIAISAIALNAQKRK